MEIKFTPDSKIWFMYDNAVVCGTITTTTLRKSGQCNSSSVDFKVSNATKCREVYHDSGFETKQQLLDSL